MEKLGVTEESIQHTMVATKPDLQSECNSGYGRDRIDLKSSSAIAEIKNQPLKACSWATVSLFSYKS